MKEEQKTTCAGDDWRTLSYAVARTWHFPLRDRGIAYPQCINQDLKAKCHPLLECRQHAEAEVVSDGAFREFCLASLTMSVNRTCIS